MGKINSVKKLTDNKFVNLYGVDATSVHDTPVSYFVASRAKCVEDLSFLRGESSGWGDHLQCLWREAG